MLDIPTTVPLTSRRLRLLIVGANLPPVYTGGGQQAVTLGAALRSLGHEVFFLSRRFGSLPAHDLVCGLEIQRVTYDTERDVGLHIRICHVWALCRRFVQLRGRYDLVLFFNVEGGFHNSWPAILVLHAFGKKTATRMTLVGANDPLTLRRKRFAWLRLIPYRLHNVVISISTALSLSFRSEFGDDHRLTYIPNGVDITRFHPLPSIQRKALRHRLGLDEDRQWCACVGRISFRKGIDILVESWRHVLEAVPAARLLLIGPTEDSDRGIAEIDFLSDIRTRIQEYHLEDSIHWVGRTERVEEYLQAADLFLFASRREGCPNALIEAMACGLPIVSTRIEHITDDLVANGDNGLITSSDPTDFARATIQVLTSNEFARSLGRNALKTAQSRFAIEATARRYAEILSTL